jgi:predicted aldo/keto reductase-like oxidoreductase
MIEKQPFGRTGHMSTRAIFGAWALSKATQEEADRTLEMLLGYGINHIDTAAMYGDSERRIGPWMDRHRQDFFLATKTHERTYPKAREQFHHSLETLRADHVDLLQLHLLVDPEEWEVAMGPGGALEVVVEAREQGLAHFIGVTGHGLTAPAMHKRSLERFDFDSVLLPYNYLLMQNPEYATDLESLMALCQERNVAVQTIKSIGRRVWKEKPRAANTWYEPLTDQAAIDKTVHWVLGRPGIFVNTVGDMHLLPKVLDAVSRFQTAPSEKEMEKVVIRMEMAPLWT